MRKVWIVLAVLAAIPASRVALAQGQEGPTLGGHIGFVLPLVTHVGGQTINDTADQFSIGFPVGVTVKGTGRTSFDLELVPFINTARPRTNSLTVHPGLIWSLGHGFGAGVRAAFDVNTATWGFTPLVNHSRASTEPARQGTRRLSAVNRPGKSGASGNSGTVHPCVFVDARLVNGGAE